jgi:antitoxin component of RelBE/YafQ-DinJ toxin-antitoxin module
VKEVRFNMRIDPKLKKEVAAVAKRRNMTLAALTTALYAQVVEADRVERQHRPNGEVEQV